MCTFQLPGTRKELVNEHDIIVMVADGRGCDLYVVTNAQKKEWVRKTSSHNLGHYKKLLAGTRLLAVHRKYIVNIDLIAAYDIGYRLELKIDIGRELKVSKRNIKAFKAMLNSRSLQK